MRKNTPKDHPSILRPPPGTPGGRRGRPEDTELRTRIIPFYATLGFDCYATSARVWAKGVTPGIPDLYVMRPGWGIAFWHEVKTGATRQSQAQRLFEEQCAGSGVPYVLGDLDMPSPHRCSLTSTSTLAGDDEWRERKGHTEKLYALVIARP